MELLSGNWKSVLGVVLLGAGNQAQAVEAIVKEKPQDCVIAGAENAPITIEEYADFVCPFCAKGAATMQKVLKEYPGKVKLVYRNVPLPVHEPVATEAAKAFAAICLQNPHLAYEYNKALFSRQKDLVTSGEKILYSEAEKLGLDVKQMKLDMAGEAVAKRLAEDQKLADEYHFAGTPSFLVGNEPIVGAVKYEEFKKSIDRQLPL